VTYFWLTAITASRLLCGPLWAWLWRKPRRLRPLFMFLIAAWFLLTDHFDGHWARDNGLTSKLGAYLDHGADFVFYSCVVFSLIFGSGDAPPALRRRRPVAKPSIAEREDETLTPPPVPPPPPV
jgi:phosphatidylglycerophosphate synthase